MSGPHGVLVVDKPQGMTSHDVVAQARRRFGTRSVGHAGTLDPMATGVLLLLFGEGTKLSPYLAAEEKEYRAVVSFGRSTDTLDAEGQTVSERAVSPGWLDHAELERALAQERARTEQVPPAFSAIKVGGERAHRMIRRGETPELAPRPVHVRALELEAASDEALTLRLSVSKGYFVRSLAQDVCDRLGMPGHLSALRRLRSGPFRIEDAAPFPPEGTQLIAVPEAARRCLPAAELTPDAVARARQGKALGPADFAAPPGEGPAAWLGPDGALVAVGALAEPELYRVVRGFAVIDS